MRSYWRSLRTKLAAASPFHCCLVSPGSKRTFLRALRTMLTTGVSPKFEIRSVIAVTGVSVLPASRLALHTRKFARPIRECLSHMLCIDKLQAALENRKFSLDTSKAPPMKALLKTNLGATPLLGRGKVRDLYAVDDALLLVATDRISAFDHVLATGIPGKGKILTQISLFWFDFFSDLVPNHLITANVNEFPASLRPYADQLEGRSMLVRRAKMYPGGMRRARLPGRIGLERVSKRVRLCAEFHCPRDCRMASKLPEAIFTPATKSEGGAHDENISFAATEKLLGTEVASELRQLTLAIYARAAKHAEARGLILADTKFEFGATAERHYSCR